MDNVKELIERLADEIGFDCRGACSAKGLETRPEVRDMCAANLCRHYDSSWSCPPACGTVEEYEGKMRAFDDCVLVQTVGQMEDPYDFETVEESAQIHDKRFRMLVEQLREKGTAFLPLGAGPCMLCAKCTYPEAPCRFPDKMVVSMEASGLVVNEVCTKAGIPYNHGANTISFTGYILY